MGDGINTQEDLQHAQDNAQELHAAFLPAGESVDDGERAMDAEPAGGHVEQDGIVHRRDTGYRNADNAQDQAEDRQEEMLVVAFFEDGLDNADDAVDEEQHDDAGTDAQVGEQRGGQHGNAADDRQDAHDREQDRRTVAAAAGSPSDDDHVDAGLNEVEADQETQADRENRGMRNGINGHEDLQRAQGNAQDLRQGIVIAGDGVDDGQNAVNEEPAGGDVQNDEIVHGRRAGHHKADDAQDQAEDGEEELLVVALLTDRADDAEKSPDEKQDDDVIARTHKVKQRRCQHGNTPEDHQDPHDHEHGKRCHFVSS